MSNRLRILFHCGMEGSVAHVGRHALKAMESYLRPLPQQHWVTNGDWIKLGRPKFTERHLKADANGQARYIYLVNADALDMPKPKIQVPEGTLLERAKWLWAALPPEVRKHSQLLVMRENRFNCWRRSAANPSRQGWSKPGDPGMQAPHFEKVADSVWSFSKDLVGAALGIKDPSAPTPAKKAVRYPARAKTPNPYMKAQAIGTEAKKPKLKVGIWS